MPAHSSLRHPKKTLMKASSFDVLRQLSFEQENIFNHSPSTLPKQDTTPRRPASSGNLIAQIAKYGEHESSLAFQVGNTSGDDVFTDRPASGAGCRASSSKETGDSAEESSTGSEEKASQRDGSWSLIPRETIQVDAQSIYPSSACVFVANLTQAFDDRRLEIEVTKYFSQFGTVFVKIRRDSHQMPFAFCQFTCDADAENAGKHGNGAMILGRPCRVEKATAHSCFVVYKLSGAETTRQEAIDLLGVLGPISEVYPLDLNKQKTEKFPPAMVVHYKRYDSSRSVTKTFEGHPVFRVDAYDPKAEIRQQHKKSDQQSYVQYEKDRRSAYFGNLPLKMTADVLKSLASQCGKVLCAEVATKEVPQVGGRTVTTCFGFVEFVRPDSIDDAIMTYHRKSIDGHIIKVERKRTRTFNGPSYGTNTSQRVSFAGMPSTWHGDRGSMGNSNGNGNRIINAHTFIPPGTMLPATNLPTRVNNQEDCTVSPTKADRSHPLPRMNDKQQTQFTATVPTLNEESCGTSVRFPNTLKYISPGQSMVFGRVEESELGKAVEGRYPAENKEEMSEEKLANNIEAKEEERGLKSASKSIETADKQEFISHGSHKNKLNESLCDFKDVESINNTTKDDPKKPETPTKSPTKTAVRPSPAYGAESAATCFYPIIHPYPYSPYGFHPIQSLMANPMTPQGGSIMYNSFSHAYYSPPPYSDMYAMYPMVQQYPSAAVETPTRASASSHGGRNQQQESRTETYAISPKSGEKTDEEGKGKAH
ncbi:uncharacterized protein TRIVIDRAFT_28754 [Trichoderma virens Gv29-8]|uniref:RRM domain-containing protein n=1 Tax=Hypocrea virens (strain Gv29-8 / FGSC 10586) TaxID=413071 RepID=G9MR03_HYPVG|nr:uncharacterized protein TRIVIDRAFT_28754 [Trichoderma virens Gv29-8]EHK22530.1 hypothetical protein TRIVIDRAFT_28754 [Trichoderma virens Gv29-8]UKZ47573.1 hypothetical protein TrVGV298_001796 [Trichoderma virens]